MPAPKLLEYITFAAAGSLDEIVSDSWAWKVIDYTPLRRRTRVGENRAIPGAEGGSASPPRIFVPRGWDEHTVVLTWRINGKYAPDGTPHADPFEGVDVNHQVLLDNLVNSLDLRGTTFRRRDASDHVGDIVVDDWEPAVDPASGGDHIVSPLTMKIPAGWLEPA